MFFVGIVISAILTVIIDMNIKPFLKSKNVDIETHKTGLLINIETDGKDKKEYDKYMGRIYTIFVIIFSILSYIILPKL